MEKIIKYMLEKNISPSMSLSIIDKNQIKDYYCGYADLQTKQLIDKDTLYDLASLTKLFTLTCICILEEQNKLNYQDKVSKYLNDFIHKDITIYNLLTHSSGIINNINYKEHTKESYIKAIYNIKLEYDTNKQAVYTDIGYILLGFIIEKITNQTLDKFMKEQIFDKLEMNVTTFRAHDNVASTEVIDGKSIKGIVHDEKSRLLGGVVGHAGLFSNVTDLNKFMLMVLNNGIYKNNQLLKKTTIDLWFKEMVYDKITEQKRSYSFIVGNKYLTNKCSKETIMHTGFTGTSLLIDRDNKIGICLLSNRIHPTRNNKRFNIYRKILHSLIYDELRIKA